MAFGVYPETSLADARHKREAARKLVEAGIDPREQKRAVKEELAKEVFTFEVVAREWHATNKKWSKDHSARVLKTLEVKWFTELVSPPTIPPANPPASVANAVTVCFSCSVNCSTLRSP
jgi:hypothetical protein